MSRRCDYCDAEITMVETDTGRFMPCEAKPETVIAKVAGQYGRLVKLYRPHWQNCPGADQARKRGKK